MYEAFYNLSTKPFQLSPDPRFFFNSTVHKRAMSYLRYGISQGEGIIVITGGIGTGKTTLVRNLFAELDQEKVIAAQLVTTSLEPEELLKMVSAAFGLPHEGLSKGSLLKQFENFLKKCEFQDKRVLLVIDEAQNLPIETVEEIRMLSNFQSENRSLIQSFLLGQEEFRKTVQSPKLEQMRQRIIASCHLNPLDKKETRLYIEHRLKEVGWSSRPVITDIAFELIHKFTEGVPRRINVFCDRLMLYGYLEELFIFKPEVINIVAEELAKEIGTSEPDQEQHEGALEAGSPDASGATVAPPPIPIPAEPDPELVAELASVKEENADMRRQIKHLETAVDSMEKSMLDKIELLRQTIKLIQK